MRRGSDYVESTDLIDLVELKWQVPFSNVVLDSPCPVFFFFFYLVSFSMGICPGNAIYDHYVNIISNVFNVQKGCNTIPGTFVRPNIHILSRF